MTEKGRVAILLSGRGSNFEAIWNDSRRPDANYRVVAVVSDNEGARGLTLARQFGLPAFFVDPGQRRKQEYEAEVVRVLQPCNPQLVCLAGYMRVVGAVLLRAYPGAVINIHPSLLPSFPGLHGQKQALDHGVKITGCTVHFVDSGVDTGPIILQHPIEVLDNDSEESLSHRLLSFEHQLFPRAIRLFFNNQLKINGRKVIISA